MRGTARHLWVLAAAVALGGCGGSDSGTPAAPAATSYWTLDAIRYQNGGHSAQSTAVTGGIPTTVATVSTATLAGGDLANGAFSGSSVSFTFKGTAPGTFNVVPNRATFASSTLATPNPMLVEITVGTAVTTGSTLFTAASGQVQVRIQADGKMHFDTISGLPMAKTMDVLGGVAGAPATMTLVVYDAY